MQTLLHSPFEILKDHPSYLVVHKAPGISFHSEGKQASLLALLREQEPHSHSHSHSHSIEESLDSRKRLFPVHRLDRVSSGILLFARGRKNADRIANLFRHRRIEKVYIALSDRRAKKKSGVVSGGMAPTRRGAWRLTREKKNMAKTSFFSLPVFEKKRPGLRLYVLKPVSGRTHQLRVAMKSIGAPILGDGLYGRYDLARQEERTYLHAYALRFFLEDEEISIVDLPRPGLEFRSEAFQKALARLGDISNILNKFKIMSKNPIN